MALALTTILCHIFDQPFVGDLLFERGHGDKLRSELVFTPVGSVPLWRRYELGRQGYRRLPGTR